MLHNLLKSNLLPEKLISIFIKQLEHRVVLHFLFFAPNHLIPKLCQAQKHPGISGAKKRLITVTDASMRLRTHKF